MPVLKIVSTATELSPGVCIKFQTDGPSDLANYVIRRLGMQIAEPLA